MANLTPALYGASVNETTITSLAVDLPIFQVGDEVMWLGDLKADGADLPIVKTVYTVESITFGTKSDGADIQVIDQAKDAAVPCDGSTSRAPEGFDHVATPTALTAVTATTVSRPWFYALIAADSTRRVEIHQSQINLTANFTTYLFNTGEAVNKW